MKKLALFFWMMSVFLPLLQEAQAQSESEQLFIEMNPGRQYSPENVGNFSGAMKSCFNNYNVKNYFLAYQTTVKIMNKMSPLERNQAMGEFQYVLRTRTFNGRSLSGAECERISSSDWPSYLLEPN
jgi:hypothetical protein